MKTGYCDRIETRNDTLAKAAFWPSEFGEMGVSIATSGSNRGWPRGQSEGVENLPRHDGVLDGCQDAHPRAAAGALQHIECENALHQLRPRIISTRIFLFCGLSMFAGFSSRSGCRQRHDGRPLFRCRGEDSKIPHQMETRSGYQGGQLFDQFSIVHHHVRRAVAPRCFHPVRQAAAGETFQALDSPSGGRNM